MSDRGSDQSSSSSDSAQHIPPKAQTILTDQRSLRTCILLQHLQGKDPMEGYNLLCKSLGPKFMEYSHFNYWFMGLADETLTLDSADRFNASQVKQCIDLPDNHPAMASKTVLQTNRFSTVGDAHRSQSNIREGRNVKGIFLSFENSELAFDDDISFDNEQDDDGCIVEVEYKDDKKKTISKKKWSLKFAMKDLSAHLNGKKLVLDDFVVIMGGWRIAQDQEKWFEALQSILHSNGTVSAKCVSFVSFMTSYQTAQFLKHFESGFLERISIDADDASVEKIVCLEQYKQATSLSLGSGMFSEFFKHIDHFKSLKFCFFGKRLSKNHIELFRDNVIAKSVNLESCTFEHLDFSEKSFLTAFNAPKSATGSFVYKANKRSFTITSEGFAYHIKKNSSNLSTIKNSFPSDFF
ncbi:F-box A protein 155 [Caenorhabditis elegans]|uniref:F-box A protein 155 n=1 Tax=Caenorhabditis elegans TaxID=6239 RepID=FB155_CAEEL|nr:F-box A protein 155 [Caenorhabditis elegans]P34294.2 RecName: Full=F-box A protein 155 [Caenorhabditis elegans]CAA83594.2 F-box A protein 155 [Caenorhabditis elegans]|eukprot:NP_499220.2 F-box A protein 155 [Caenorhabditis elegans]